MLLEIKIAHKKLAVDGTGCGCLNRTPRDSSSHSRPPPSEYLFEGLPDHKTSAAIEAS